ncbi:MAG: UvrD-helicase domain-containing protein [Chloroflexi bacterium]|nr:UvrD-helicase domain-containing protein [Chloroflexota bacterium]
MTEAFPAAHGATDGQPGRFLQGLSTAQAEAVVVPGGPLLVLAGPGSGKTRVIAHRIAYLLQGDVAPWEMLAVTFTNRAAREMRERVQTLLGHEADGLTLGTFHAICARMLRRDGQALGIDRNFNIFDTGDQLELVRQALSALGVDPKRYAPRALLHGVSKAKSEGRSAADLQQRSGSYFEEIVARVFEHYPALLGRNGGLDFDDLLLRALELFDTVPEVRARYQNRYRHVLVDEFQDTNLVQYRLARAWAAGTGNLTVVGDPDQSIYSWRAADIRNILHFERDHPQAKVVRLEQNYRSTKAILHVADAVIQKTAQRLHKSLWTENEAGHLPVVREAYNEIEEARFVVEELQRHWAAGEWEPGDVAVMYRTNAQSRVLEEEFLRAGLPHRIVGATRFYERKEIKDLLAYLRLIHNPSDSVSFARIVNVPGRGIGKRTQEVLVAWGSDRNLSAFRAAVAVGEIDGPKVASRAVPPLQEFVEMIEKGRRLASEATVVELLDFLLRKTGYREHLSDEFDDAEERWENLRELGTVASKYDGLPPDRALPAFLESVALVSDQDDLDSGPPNAVSLLTLHTAKGLEFPVVFLVGMEEGVLPHSRAFDDPDSLEEERRLCYVGITRAQRRLYLLYAFRRALAGNVGRNSRSRYLADIPADAVDTRGQTTSTTVAPAPTTPGRRTHTWDDYDGVDVEPIPRVPVGARVHHATFGPGVVVDRKDVKDDQEVTVDFEEAGVKKLVLSLAPMDVLSS